MTTTAQDLSNEILNEIELEALLRFKEDKVAFNAMKKYVLAVVYKHGVIKSGEDYNGNINFALNLAWRATQSSDNAQSSSTETVASGGKHHARGGIPINYYSNCC